MSFDFFFWSGSLFDFVVGSTTEKLAGSAATLMWECLTAWKALSHANAKGKGVDSKGWAFRML